MLSFGTHVFLFARIPAPPRVRAPWPALARAPPERSLFFLALFWEPPRLPSFFSNQASLRFYQRMQLYAPQKTSSSTVHAPLPSHSIDGTKNKTPDVYIRRWSAAKDAA